MTGFIGLGLMGEPIALNLVRAGVPLIVWNRNEERCASLRAAGAEVAPDADELFARSSLIVLMVSDGAAVDAVLGRGTAAFSRRVEGRTIVCMGTESPGYSASLERAITDAGGAYVEAPVSGSRVPAAEGALVAMLAGTADAVARARIVIEPACRISYLCGPVPNALLMKLAVNIVLIATVAGLAEAFHFAQSHALDGETLRQILDAGQMASDVSRVKLPKLLTRDFSPQAAIRDVVNNTRFITGAARGAGVATPIMDVCGDLFEETLRLGAATADMSAVLCAIEARTRLVERM